MPIFDKKSGLLSIPVTLIVGATKVIKMIAIEWIYSLDKKGGMNGRMSDIIVSTAIVPYLRMICLIFSLSSYIYYYFKLINNQRVKLPIQVYTFIGQSWK